MNKESIDPLSIAEAVELFCKGISLYGPVWEHHLEYWMESQKQPNKILFLKYENLKAEPEANVRKLAEFMRMPFSPEEESIGMVAEIVKLCSFKSLKEFNVNKVGFLRKRDNIAIKNSSYFRKGKIGDWKDHLSAEMAEKVDTITRDKLHDIWPDHLPLPPDDSARVVGI